MKISLAWIKDWVDLPWNAEETAARLTELGFPVEKMTRSGIQVAGVVAAEILAVEKHPNADRLRVARVRDGEGERVVVCGAPNIAAGQVVPLARPGVRFSDGMVLAVTTIRGVASHGMLCSERELGLSEEHGGILQLPAGTPPGTAVETVFPSDVILEIDVTPNRPDALSHIGVARELAAFAGVPLKHHDQRLPPAAGGGKTPPCQIRVGDPRCTRYLGRLIHGVRVGPSPRWMVERLAACGVRPINNVVDITNYVLLEWGHPLHAFDVARLRGGGVVVRAARAGEQITALDERRYDLTGDDLIIADDAAPVAIAGVMGGALTGILDATTDVFLESAVFDRVSVRRTARRLALRTESSLRFEKGTDPVTAEGAMIRATQLLCALAGGTVGAAEDVYPAKAAPVSVSLRHSRLERVMGEPVSPARAETILSALAFAPEAAADGWRCVVPPHRKDIAEEMDLIEEVARHIGYNTFGETLPPVRPGQIPPELAPPETAFLEETLRGMGFSEALTSSLCPVEWAVRFGVPETEVIAVANPLSQEESVMRPLLTPLLLRAAIRNVNRQRASVLFFEIGRRMWQRGGAPHEELAVALLALGDHQPPSWQAPARAVDVFFLKGVWETLLRRLGADVTLRPAGNAPEFLHPRQAFDLCLGDEVIGWAGLLSPRLAVELEVSAPVAIAEARLAPLLAGAGARRFAPLSRHPFVERDVSIALREETPWGLVASEVRRAGGALVKAVFPFDVYTGKGVQTGEKSIAFRVRLGSDEKTLSDAEVTAAVDRIVDALKDRCAARRR